MYISIRKRWQHKVLPAKWIVGLIYLVIGAAGLSQYLHVFSLTFILGLVAILFSLEQRTSAKSLHSWVCLLFCLLAWFIPVKTFLFFGLGAAIFFLVEWFGYKAGLLSFTSLVVMSPVIKYAVTIFSFPIRLKLTAAAGVILSLFTKGVQAKGNIILVQGTEFSVDPACMGLNMLEASVLLGVILIGYYQYRLRKKLGIGWMLCFFLAVFLFNLINNLIRIIFLTLFSILPQSPLHEWVGLLCLIMYVALPTGYLAKKLVAGKGYNIVDVPIEAKADRNLGIHTLLILSLMAIVWRIHFVDTYDRFKHLEQKEVAGFKKTMISPGLIKLDDAEGLIYIKFVRGFYDTDHNPSICWVGSGYELSQVEEKVVRGTKIYTAFLKNGTETLSTAWWYSNGSNNTNSQFEWRMDALSGRKTYAIINITTATPQRTIDLANATLGGQNGINGLFKL